MPVHPNAGRAGQTHPGVVVEEVEDFYLGSVGQLPVRDVGLPEFVGWAAVNRFQAERGRLCGWDSTKPRRR